MEDTVKNEENLCQTKIEMSSLSHPPSITIRIYSTGIMQTTMSGIMNLEHEKAQNIKDKVIEIPVNVGINQHQEFGAYLIDAGLDQTYVTTHTARSRCLWVKAIWRKAARNPTRILLRF